MSIKEQIVASLERQISDIKALEERQVAVIKDKVIREKVAPFNQEIDQARVKAENELLQKLNANIKALQEQFSKEKQLLLEVGEKKKAEYLNSVMASETYQITSECDKIISKLNSQVKELKE